MPRRIPRRTALIVFAVLLATTGIAYAGSITTPTGNPFIVPGDAVGNPMAFTVVGSGFTAGTQVFLEQCDGVAPSAPGWSPASNCDLASSPAPATVAANGTATFSTSDPNRKFTPFKGESPQSIFNCLSPNDPSPNNGLPDYRNCKIRLSTNNLATTGDQAFLNIQLPDAVAATTTTSTSTTTSTTSSTTTTSTSTTTSTTSTTTVPPTTTTTTVPPATAPVDHFLCYTASAPGKGQFANRPVAAELENAFVPGGFFASLASVNTLCNPVAKTTPSGTTGIGHPDAHLVCNAIKTNPFGAVAAPHDVVVTNQFGTATVSTAGAKTLCLPSFKDAANNPPQFPAASAPSGLDQYTCYAAKYPVGAAKFAPPTPVTLADQFGNWGAKVTAPNLLCLPTHKTVDPAVPGAPILHSEALLCFGASLTPAFAERQVFAKNQFGIGQVTMKRATKLCLPSTTGGGGS